MPTKQFPKKPTPAGNPTSTMNIPDTQKIPKGLILYGSEQHTVYGLRNKLYGYATSKLILKKVSQFRSREILELSSPVTKYIRTIQYNHSGRRNKPVDIRKLSYRLPCLQKFQDMRDEYSEVKEAYGTLAMLLKNKSRLSYIQVTKRKATRADVLLKTLSYLPLIHSLRLRLNMTYKLETQKMLKRFAAMARRQRLSEKHNQSVEFILTEDHGNQQNKYVTESLAHIGDVLKAKHPKLKLDLETNMINSNKIVLKVAALLNQAPEFLGLAIGINTVLDMKKMATAIQNNPDIDYVHSDIENKKAKLNGYNLLMDSLSKLHALKKISLKFIAMPVGKGESFISKLGGLVNLEQLVLEFPEGLKLYEGHQAELAKALLKMPKLKSFELYFRGYNYGTDKGHCGIKHLFEALKDMKQLESIVLRHEEHENCIDSEVFQILCSSLENLTKLRALDLGLSESILKTNDIKRFADVLALLTEIDDLNLDFGDIPGITRPAWVKLFENIGTLKRLTHLTVFLHYTNESRPLMKEMPRIFYKLRGLAQFNVSNSYSFKKLSLDEDEIFGPFDERIESETQWF